MSQKRVTLYINGINISLITDEDETYLKELSKEISGKINEIASGSIEKSAVIAALTYLDENNKLKKELEKIKEEAEFYKKGFLPEKEIPEVKNPLRERNEIKSENYKAFYVKKGGEKDE